MREFKSVCGAIALATALGLAEGSDDSQNAVQTILVQDLTVIDSKVLPRAEMVATRLFGLAKVEVHWLHCPVPTGQGPHPCPAYPPGTIFLRIVPTSPDFIKGSPLGYALPAADGGKYATVSFHRVQLRAARKAISSEESYHVLGHAIAHEVAHILLGAGSHSSRGLMQPEWDGAALDDAAKGRLVFSRDEAKRLRIAVIQRAARDQ